MRRFLRVYAPDELGVDGYPVDWPAIKQFVRGWAGDRCVRCRHPYQVGEHGSGEWSPCDRACSHGAPVRFRSGHLEASWRILTVHHLDGDKANCRWWNLATLCQRCHLSIQGRVRMAQVYPFEHSEWFKPYAAGYYAAAYLGQEIDRYEAETRLEELLGLERIA